MHAMLSDDAAFLATYQDLQQSQTKPHPTDRAIEQLQQLLERFLEEEEADDLPIKPEAPPLNISRPAEDATPDAEKTTQIDRWLDDQFGRAA